MVITARNCENQAYTREKLMEFPLARRFAAGQTGFVHHLLDTYFLEFPNPDKPELF